MLEIPEAHTVARQIDETLTGKTIRRAQAGQSPHGFAWYHEDPSHYPLVLEGRCIQGAESLAGYVRIEAQDSQMLFHDGVNIRYVEGGGKLPAKHQLLLDFDDGSHMVCTVQMYGALLAFPKDAFDNHYFSVAREKPSPLSADFDEEYFDSIVRDTPAKLSAKALLATEQRIPGLGNGCLQDILFAAGVHPQSKLSALSEDDFSALYRSTKGVLAEMTAKGGRDTEKDFFGQPGGYLTLMSKNTVNHPCPVCGGSVVKKAFLGGNVYFCPACQPLKK